MWNYVVLAVAGVVEGSSFVIALREFLAQAGATPFWEALHRSKDPTTYTVLAEDSAALVGLVVAAVGIALSQHFGMPELDGAASLVIGVLLAGVAVALIIESRGLLIGEGVRPEDRACDSQHRAGPAGRARRRPRAVDVHRPDDVLVTMDLDFDDGTETTDAAVAIKAVGAAGARTLPDDQAAVHRGGRSASAGALEPAGCDANVAGTAAGLTFPRICQSIGRRAESSALPRRLTFSAAMPMQHAASTRWANIAFVLRRTSADCVRACAHLALGGVLLAFAATATAQIHKCIDAQGKATYQQQPCDAKSASQSTLSAPAAAPAPPPRAPDGRPPPGDPRNPIVLRENSPPPPISDRDLMILLMSKLGCDEELPDSRSASNTTMPTSAATIGSRSSAWREPRSTSRR